LNELELLEGLLVGELNRAINESIIADLYKSRQDIKKENRLKNIKLLKRRLKIAKLCKK